jgi:nitroreductase
VSRWPAESDPDLLATLAYTGRSDSDTDASADVEVARVRRSDRRPFRSDDVDSELLDNVRAASTVDRVHVDFPQSEDQRIALASAVSWADRAEREDPAYLEEMRRWVNDPDVHHPRTDGIPTDVVPHVTVAHPRRTDVPLRDFELGATGRQMIARDVDERPVMAVVLTESDAPEDQLRAGEAMMRLWIAGDRAGLRSCPVSQAVDLDAFRYRLQGLMGWVGLPQIVLRMGHPVGDEDEAPLTPRRPVGDFLRVVDE